MTSVERFRVRSEDDVALWTRLEPRTTDEAFPLLRTPTDVRTKFTWVSDYADVRGYLCRDDRGEPVGYAVLEMPKADNITLAHVHLAVALTERRHGFGSALAERVRQEALAEQRTTWTARCAWAPDQETSPGRQFAERLGLTCRMTDYHQVLPLPVETERLRSIAKEADVRASAYRIVRWQGRCPDAWLDEFAAVQGRMNDEAPTGELDIEAEVYDGSRIRNEEAELAARGRTPLTAVAVSPEGQLVGFTQLVVSEHDVNAFQWDTLVLPEHRGHHLGLALKAQNLLAMTELPIACRVLHTWNAISNEPMIAVNDAFGFSPADYLGEFQGSLTG